MRWTCSRPAQPPRRTWLPSGRSGDEARKVKKTETAETRSLIHGPDSGSADRPAYSWGDQWRRHSGTTVGPRGPLWTRRASLPTLAGRWIKNCWRGTNIWPRKPHPEEPVEWAIEALRHRASDAREDR